MRAVAYAHGPDRIHVLAKAFALGCKRRGIVCEVRHIDRLSHSQPELVWLYGLGPAKVAFDHHPDAVRLVGDKGYFSEYASGTKYFRVSINSQQPDEHLRRIEHGPIRWQRLNIRVNPVQQRGDYILLCGMGPKQAVRQDYAYGQWERKTYAELLQHGRPILVREKPKNPPIEGLPRSTHTKTSEAIRGAHAVVCRTGNIGVDAILEGVPVIAQAGPGKIYYPTATVDNCEPLSPDARLQALSDIAHWQWTAQELSTGHLIDNLKAEGII